MGTNRKTSKTKKIKTHRLSYIIVVAVLFIAGIVGGIWLFRKVRADRQNAKYQRHIQDFYTPPSPLPSAQPGHIIRSEKLDITVPYGGTAYRILYVTQTPDGKAAASSGMIFVPSGDVPAGGRKVVAWAHGTLGFGDDCTPSRNYTNPLNDMQAWLDAAMQRGYVVAASDYVGVGTPGDPLYLIGKSEAYDVLNSVRAAINMPEAAASKEFIPYGHSQGGHAALFTAIEASRYAPELKLLGVAAAAPAAELDPLFAQQFSKPMAWAIGPDAAVSWPLVYPDLHLESVLSKDAHKKYRQLAFGCVLQQIPGLTIRALLKQQFFAANPVIEPGWKSAIAAETPNMAAIPVPIYVAQGLADPVVLPNTTALLAQKACAAGRTIKTSWMGGMNHQLAAVTAGPDIMDWMQDRFTGQPANSSCSQPLPVTPAEE